MDWDQEHRIQQQSDLGHQFPTMLVHPVEVHIQDHQGQSHNLLNAYRIDDISLDLGLRKFIKFQKKKDKKNKRNRPGVMLMVTP